MVLHLDPIDEYRLRFIKPPPKLSEHDILYRIPIVITAVRLQERRFPDDRRKHNNWWSAIEREILPNLTYDERVYYRVIAPSERYPKLSEARIKTLQKIKKMLDDLLEEAMYETDRLVEQLPISTVEEEEGF